VQYTKRVAPVRLLDLLYYTLVRLVQRLR
jgi:hypothetical protein